MSDDAPRPARHIGVTIDRDADAVYDFLAEPPNFARWASGLGKGLRQEGGRWLCEGPQGPVQVRFSPRNAARVADHWVSPDGGTTEIAIPIRVIPNGRGAEVVLTLLRLPGVDDAHFEQDAAWVQRDLATLKGLLEGAA